MENSEAIQIKSELGCISRRLYALCNNEPGSEISGDLDAAADAADKAYEAMKGVLEKMGETP